MTRDEFIGLLERLVDEARHAGAGLGDSGRVDAMEQEVLDAYDSAYKKGQDDAMQLLADSGATTLKDIR